MKRSRDVLLRPPVPVDRRWPVNLKVEDTELFRDEISYSTLGSVIRSFGKAWVSPDSVVYKGGLVVAETVVTKDQVSYYRLRHLAKKLLTARRVRLNDRRKYLLITDAWSGGHFHWLTEALPKLWTVRERAWEFVLLLPDSSYVRTAGVESLNFLGVDFEDIIFMKEAEFYKVNDLYYIPRIADLGCTDDTLMKELNAAFTSGKAGGNHKIYISREKARARKVLNEATLTEKLKEYGIETISTDDLSLANEIDIFARCSLLVGIHGAGLTNCIFMQPGGNVVELRKREKNYGYWHLADSLDHKYYYYHGIADSDASLIGSGSSLTVPIEDFERRILRTI